MTRPQPSQWDQAASLACAALVREFGLSGPAGVETRARGGPTIGAEIEIPWSGYFPELWDEFGLSAGFPSLAPEAAVRLSEACSLIEAGLRPRLLKSVECGIPRGNDRYWEFAFDPVDNPLWIARKVALLSEAGLLPNNGGRSLQLTIAGLTQGPDAQALARLLEAHASSPDRLAFGLRPDRPVIHTGWARKGSGGVHQKEAGELKGGAQSACEFRTLTLPQSQRALEELLEAASLGAQAIIERSTRPDSPLASAWLAWRAGAENLLSGRGAAPLTWESREAIDPKAWAAYVEHFFEVSVALKESWRLLFKSFGAVAPESQTNTQGAAPRSARPPC